MSRTWFVHEKCEDSFEESEDESDEERNKEKPSGVKKKKRLSLNDQIDFLASLACMKCGELCDSKSQLKSHEERLHSNTPCEQYESRVYNHDLESPQSDQSISEMSTNNTSHRIDDISSDISSLINEIPDFNISQAIPLETISQIDHESNNSIENNTISESPINTDLIDKVSIHTKLNDNSLEGNQNVSEHFIHQIEPSTNSLEQNQVLDNNEHFNKSPINSSTPLCDKINNRKNLIPPNDVIPIKKIRSKSKSPISSKINNNPIENQTFFYSPVEKLSTKCSKVIENNPHLINTPSDSNPIAKSSKKTTKITKNKTQNNSKSKNKMSSSIKFKTSDRLVLNKKLNVSKPTIASMLNVTPTIETKSLPRTRRLVKKFGNIDEEDTSSDKPSSKRKQRNSKYLQIKLPSPHSETTISTAKRLRMKYLNHECEVCGKKFVTPSKLARHARQHTGKKIIKCQYCDKEFSREDNLYKHVMSVHRRTKLYECNYCKKRFLTKSGLSYHNITCTSTNVCIQKENIKNYFCDFCKKGFKHMNSLRNHITRLHLFEQEYLCLLCKNTFSTKYHVRRHFNSVHKKIKCFRCALCPYKCADKANLSFHFLANHAKK